MMPTANSSLIILGEGRAPGDFDLLHELDLCDGYPVCDYCCEERDEKGVPEELSPDAASMVDLGDDYSEESLP